MPNHGVAIPDGHHTAGLNPAATRTALERLVAELVTVDTLEVALRALPLEAAMRAVIGAPVEGARDLDAGTWRRSRSR